MACVRSQQSPTIRKMPKVVTARSQDGVAPSASRKPGEHQDEDMTYTALGNREDQ